MKQPVRKRIAEANGLQTGKTEYTLLVDGNNLLKISFVDKRMNDKGQEYGAVMTFLRKLGEVLKKKDFNYCIVSWDGLGSGIMRWKLYPDYKANRDKNYEAMAEAEGTTDYDAFINNYRKAILANKKKKETVRKETDEESFKRQKDIIQDILEELCIRQYEFEDVEGDDIVSYYVKHKRPNEKVVIMSSDKDMTQLISDSVIIWNPRMSDFVTSKNSVEALGITHENVVLEKMLCGDASDNIKGVKGLGEQTLVKYFPEIKSQKTDLETIIRRSKELLDERKASKKKPLKSLENIVNGITDGCQGNDIYEINRKIIDLSEPLLTEEAREELSDDIHLAIDTDDRDLKNVYRIIDKYKMDDIKDEEKFGNLFASFSRIILMEKRRFSEYKKKNN